MSTLRIQTVAQVVKVWAVLFGGQKSAEERQIITAKFFEALSPVYNDDAFLCAARLVEKETHFFPTIKHFLDVRESVHQIRARVAIESRTAIPEETDNLTPEEIEQNLEKVKIISDMLTGKLSIDDAVKRQEAITTYARREP